MSDDLRDWKTSRCSKAVGTADFEPLWSDAVASYPTWLPLMHLKAKHAHACHASPLKASDDGASPAYGPTASEVKKECEAVVQLVDLLQLAAFLGVGHDPTDADRNEEKEKREGERSAVVDCLGRICLVAEGEEGFDDAYKQLRKWKRKGDEGRLGGVEVKRGRLKGLRGLALAALSKVGDGEGSKGGVKEYKKEEIMALREEVWGEVGWGWMKEWEGRCKALEGGKDVQEF